VAKASPSIIKQISEEQQMKKYLGLSVAVLMMAPGVAFADWTIIHAGEAMLVAGEDIQENVSIIIHDERISEIRNGFVGVGDIEAGDEAVEVIDLSDQFVLPGLIDSHVHLTGQVGTPLIESLTRSAEYSTLLGAKYAAITLRAGFTTVRDLGSQRYSVYALRDAINNGVVAGPRIISAGLGISVTGGHGDATNALPDAWWPQRGDVDFGNCDSPDECRYRVRTIAKRGADVIKIAATGGVLSQQGRGLNQHFTDAEMEAIVEAAHLLGLKVAAHAHGKGGIEAALRAGVDSIEHSTYTDEGTMALYLESGAYMVPTLMAFNGLRGAIAAGVFTPVVEAKARSVLESLGNSTRLAVASGVKIAFGTDSAVTPHGQNAGEFALLVEYGGMTAEQALVSATLNAADLLGVADNVGTLEAGKYADIIAVDGNPLDDVTVLEHVAFVMKGGESVGLD
jgi:imidazolonepropionase-like amidohydrolase